MKGGATVLKTPDDWLPVLARELDQRATHTAKLRSYCNGNAPMPEMGRNVRQSWEAFQKKARVNYGGLAVRALKNRIRPIGVRVGGNRQTSNVRQAADRIWRDNRFSTQINMAVTDRLQVSVGYLVVGRDDDGRAVVTREKPEFFIAATDPLRPWRAVAGYKVWRDTRTGTDHCYVWVEGGRQKYKRSSKDSGGILRTHATSKDWEKDGDLQEYAGTPPIVVLGRPDGVALIEEHLDLIDSINLGKLQRLVVTAMQAFRQRGIKGDLPTEDEDGNEIDWAKVFEPAPGALWDLPSGIDVWESAETNIQPLLEGEKADRRDFAAATQTPVSVFIPDGQNQSAEGAASAKEGHIELARDEIDDIRPAAAMAMVYALRVENVEFDDATVEIDFAPPATVSLTEQFAAAGQAKSIGLARRTILRKILGMSPDEIAQDEADLAEEQLAALTLMATAGEESQAAATQGDDITARAQALGVLIRAGASPEDAARRVGLGGIAFTGAIPVSLRLPEREAAALEEK